MIHLIDLIKKDLWAWVCANTTADKGSLDQSPSGFFVREQQTSSQQPTDKEKEDLRFFGKSKLSLSAIPEARAILVSGEQSSYLVTPFDDRKDNERLQTINDAPASEFLFRVLFATKFNAPATRSIPFRIALEWAKDGALSHDFEDYLPRVDIESPAEEYATYSIDLLAVLHLIQAKTRPGGDKSWLRDATEELAIKVPEGHEWIYSEILTALESKHLQYTYLLMYRVLEFFFPMPGINDLRKETKSDETHLSLLKKCTDKLGWHWKHGQSARSVTKMAGSKRFLQPLIEMGIISPDNPDPEKAGDKLVLARNKLSHQNYQSLAIPESEIKAMTLAVVIFCTEAFEQYSQWLTTPKPTAHQNGE